MAKYSVWDTVLDYCAFDAFVWGFRDSFRVVEGNLFDESQRDREVF